MKIINKKKIYYVDTSQTFNAFHWISGKWYQRAKKVEYVKCVTNYEKFILANTKKEAISIYKERYKWNYTDVCIDDLFEWRWMNQRINHKNPNYECEVQAEEIHNFSFTELKDKLRAEEFFEYCKQEMYPIEVVLGGK